MNTMEAADAAFKRGLEASVKKLLKKPNPQEAATQFNRAGGIYFAIKELKKAADAFEKSLQFATEINDLQLITQAQFYCGKINKDPQMLVQAGENFGRLGKFPDAGRCIAEAFTINMDESLIDKALDLVDDGQKLLVLNTVRLAADAKLEQGQYQVTQQLYMVCRERYLKLPPALKKYIIDEIALGLVGISLFLKDVPQAETFYDLFDDYRSSEALLAQDMITAFKEDDFEKLVKAQDKYTKQVSVSNEVLQLLKSLDCGDADCCPEKML